MGRIGGGHVLLTSRLTGFPLDVQPLDLDVLAPADAAALLLAGSAGGRPEAPDDAAQAAALAEELGRLALALSMAAATMRARRFTFAQYRAIWRGNRARVIGWAQAITGYHHAVAETWQTSVDQLGPRGAAAAGAAGLPGARSAAGVPAGRPGAGGGGGGRAGARWTT